MSPFGFFGGFRSRRTFSTEWRWFGDADVTVEGVGIDAMLFGSDVTGDFEEAADASWSSGGETGNSYSA